MTSRGKPMHFGGRILIGALLAGGMTAGIAPSAHALVPLCGDYIKYGTHSSYAHNGHYDDVVFQGSSGSADTHVHIWYDTTHSNTMTVSCAYHNHDV